MTKKPKSPNYWREKLKNDNGLPKVVKISGKMVKRWGRGTLAIAAPKEVDAIMRKVPKGKVTTYKAVAKALNSRAYRAVGNAMNKNPYSPKVPCHRVIKSDGTVGGFASGTKTKIKMLKTEGIQIKKGKIDIKKYLHKF